MHKNLILSSQSSIAMKKIQLILFLCCVALLHSILVVAQAPNITNVLPDYSDGKFKVVFNSPQLIGVNFEIRQREEGGAWSNWQPILPVAVTGGLAVGMTGPFPAFVEYEFQVRVGSGTNWNTSNVLGNLFGVDWPVRGGNCSSGVDLNIMHNFNQPYVTSKLIFHEGLDIHGQESIANECVVAPIGARVLSLPTQTTGFSQSVDLALLNYMGTRLIQLGHLQNINPALMLQTSVKPGDQLGNIWSGVGAWPSVYSHTHMHYWQNLTDNNESFHPLSFFQDHVEDFADPFNNTPGLQDLDEDGKTIYFLKGPHQNVDLPEITFEGQTILFGDLDIVAEVADQQSEDLPFQNPANIAYWIDYLNEEEWVESVRSQDAPYELLSEHYFISELITNASQDVQDALIDRRPEHMIANEPTGYYPHYLNFIVTNAKGLTGQHSNLDKEQCWRTNANSSETSPNGYSSNGAKSRVNKQSKFKDGHYKINVILGDLLHEQVETREVLVDNFMPFLQRVEMEDDGQQFYAAEWTYSSGNPQNGDLSFDELLKEDFEGEGDLTILLTFSERMKELSMKLKQKEGSLSYATQAFGAVANTDGMLWSVVIPADWICEHMEDGDWVLEVEAVDLAGNELEGFDDSDRDSGQRSYTQLPLRNSQGQFSPSRRRSLDSAHEITVELSEYEANIIGGGEIEICPDNERKTDLFAEISSQTGNTDDPNLKHFWYLDGALMVNFEGKSAEATSNGVYTYELKKDDCILASASTTVMFKEEEDCECDPASIAIGVDGDCFEFEIPRVGSMDPNDIQGPKGIGPARWVSVNDQVDYRIRFENDPVLATAPAQNVYIYHPFDDNVNIFSFELQNFGFGSFNFEVPQGSATYTTQVDVSDSLGVAVNVTAGLDIANHRAFWILESVDPLTGLPPEQANLGFLPVNDTTTIDEAIGRGEGYVTFKVSPLQSSLTGDTLFADAQIIFDDNEPILTPTIFNTIDADDPVSNIMEVTQQSAGIYDIHWQASDIGAGFETCALFVSQDDEHFEEYVPDMVNTPFTFEGDPLLNYVFFTLATDSVGNREAYQFEADASTESLNTNADFEGLQQSYCVADNALMLVPESDGGTFSGPGVSGNIFDPAQVPTALLGSVIDIRYELNGEAVLHSTVVYDVPNASFAAPDQALCPLSDPIQLMPEQSGGTFSGPGISEEGWLDLSQVAAVYEIEISYTIGYGSCIEVHTQNIPLNQQINWFADADNDGLGDPQSLLQSCDPPDGYVANLNDTDDNCTSNTFDCAGICEGFLELDECGVCGGGGLIIWYQDLDGDGHGNPNVSMAACDQPDGYVESWYDYDDGCAEGVYDCNGVCGGGAEIDACGVCGGPGVISWYIDEDGDGLGNLAVEEIACEGPVGYVSNADDMDDNCASNAIDCYGICDGTANTDACGICEGPGPTLWFIDTDGDGLGSPLIALVDCDQPEGFVANSNDNNDNCASNIYDCLGVCDGTAVLDECGSCDGPGPLTWYIDSDGDGLGSAAVDSVSCLTPIGFVLNADDPDDGPIANQNCPNCSIPGLAILSIQPNPVVDDLLLKYRSQHRPLELYIEDVNGRRILEQRLDNPPGSGEKLLDLSHFSSGIYFLALESKEGKVVMRFIQAD